MTTITTTEELLSIMDKDPLALTPDDITSIVAYHRKNREFGPRPKKEKGPDPKVSLAEIGLAPTTPTNPIKRRF